MPIWLIVIIWGIIGGIAKQLLTIHDDNLDKKHWLKNLFFGGIGSFLTYVFALEALGLGINYIAALSIVSGFAGVELFQEMVDRYFDYKE